MIRIKQRLAVKFTKKCLDMKILHGQIYIDKEAASKFQFISERVQNCGKFLHLYKKNASIATAKQLK